MKQSLCDPGESEKLALEIINVLVASLSLVGSLLTIISYSVKKIKKHIELKRQRNHNINQDHHFQNYLQTPGSGSFSPSLLSTSTPTSSLLAGSSSSYSTNSNNNNSNNNNSTKAAVASSKLPDLIFMLAISDFCTSLFIIISQSYLMHNFSSYSNLITLHFSLEFSPCILLRGFIQYFFLSTFFWTTCISYYLYQQLSSPNQEKYIMYIFGLISWGFPLVIVLGLGFSNSFKLDPSTGWCESGKEFEFIFWFLPLVLCVLLCAFYYIRLRRLFRIKFEYRLQVNERLKQLDSTISRRLTLYIVVFLVCWIPDIIQHLISFLSCSFFPLMVVSNLLSPAQGFLNLLVYSISNKVVQAPSLKETKKLLSNSP